MDKKQNEWHVQLFSALFLLGLDIIWLAVCAAIAYRLFMFIAF